MEEESRHMASLEIARAGKGGPPANENGHAPSQRPDDAPLPLPRRRRQANLAPQPASDATAEPEPEESDGMQSAERARDWMSAFQRGTREGRSAQ
jgi:hypothetical protein